MGLAPRHRCIVYDGAPSAHLAVVAAAAIEHLAANYRCLYLNSPAMVAGMRSRLAASGIDVADAVARGALILTSEQDHIENGAFDADGMLAQLRTGVEQALRDGYVGLWASGDILWEFGGEPNLAKLLNYEIGLEQLFQTLPQLSGICQYHRDTLPATAERVALYTHEAVYINDALRHLNPYYEEPAVLRKDLTAAPRLRKD